MAELTKLPYKELLARIGNTPLVEIQKIFHSEKIRIFAKLEDLLNFHQRGIANSCQKFLVGKLCQLSHGWSPR